MEAITTSQADNRSKQNAYAVCSIALAIGAGVLFTLTIDELDKRSAPGNLALLTGVLAMIIGASKLDCHSVSSNNLCYAAMNIMPNLALTTVSAIITALPKLPEGEGFASKPAVGATFAVVGLLACAYKHGSKGCVETHSDADTNLGTQLITQQASKV